MKRRMIAVALLLLGLTGQSGGLNATPVRDDAAVRRAMSDELKRTMATLTVPNESRPYYVALTVKDSEALKVSSEAGSLVFDQSGTNRTFDVNMRVGSAKLDNSFAGMVHQRNRMQEAPVEDNYLAIRREFWRLADDAYKHGLEALNHKKGMLAARPPKAGSEVAEFSEDSAHQTVAAPQPIDLERQHKLLRERVAQLSLLLYKSGNLVSSSAQACLDVERRRLLNSEGTFTDQSQSFASLTLYAKAQADDGMLLSAYLPFTARTAEDLPSVENMQAGAKSLVERLATLRAAEMPEAGTAIVLFEGEASKQLIASLLGNSLSGAPAPKFGEGDHDSSLASKLGTEVISPFLSLSDDPTATSGPKQVPLWGHYLADAEGVVAQRVSVVENGVLKTLLMSRAPRKEIARSNGHLRSGGPGISNLFVTARRTVPRAQLLERATRESRRPAGKPMVVYIVRRLTSRASSEFDHNPFTGSHPALETFGSDDSVYAEEAYRFDGKREIPVRGLILEALTLRSLKDVLAVGDAQDAQNFQDSGEDKVAIIAPSLLLGRVDSRPATGELPRLPAYRAPK